jgi:hypothetical protein
MVVLMGVVLGDAGSLLFKVQVFKLIIRTYDNRTIL